MATPAIRLRHVLCPTDFSEFSERALRHAATIASANCSQLTVVHVFPCAAPVGGGVPPAMLQLLGPVARRKLVDRLQAFVAPVCTPGVSPRTILLEGDPAREIGRVAEALSADATTIPVAMPAAPATPEAAAATPAAGSPASTVAELAAEATRRFDLARQALRDGDWTRYGAEMRRVEEILAEIRRLSR